VQRNAAVSEQPPLTSAERSMLAKHRWERSFYPS
jgi:hypothetical protein